MRVLGIETTCDETAAAVVRLTPDGTGEILADEVMSQIAAHAAYGGVVPEIAARAHVEIVDMLIARALAQGRRRGERPRRRRRGRGAGPDRRRAGRPDGRQGDRAGDRQAADRGQPPRGACADRAPDGGCRVSLPDPAGVGRPYPDPRGQGRRRLRSARRDHGRRDRRGVRQDGQAAWPSLSRRPRGRGGGEDRRSGAFPAAAPDDGPAERRLLAFRPQDGGPADRRAGGAVDGRATSPTSARRSRRPSSTWSRTGCGWGSSASANASASRPGRWCRRRRRRPIWRSAARSCGSAPRRACRWSRRRRSSAPTTAR